MLLKPKKGTQGRDMHQKTKIVSALTPIFALVAGLCVCMPAVALAGSPLLSGYGGPGAGEQAILGSTLVGGPGGGSRSGGSSGGSTGGAQGNTGAASSADSTGGSPAARPSTSNAGSGSVGTTGSRARGVATGHGRRHPGGSVVQPRRGTHAAAAGVSAYVYPSTPRNASYDSPTLGISSDDLLALVVTIATLALLAVLTIRLGRLQS